MLARAGVLPLRTPPLMTGMTPILLAALRAPLPSVDLGEGGVHVVAPISGTAMQLVQAARTEQDAIHLWDAAALCLPTASRQLA